MGTIDTIRAALPEGELLAQLAEEAAELAQAALKLRRCIIGINPTPTPQEKAEANLIEELADVRLCAEVLDRGTRVINQIDGIAASKLGRWAKRLEEVQSAPMTNADMIRAMSDEELAFSLGHDSISDCPYPEEPCNERTCEECFIEWLRQPVKEVKGDG